MSPAVSVGGQIVAHFYDIESGAARYEKRGAGHVSGFHFPIPRDGGLLDLLQGAESGRFDVVVCESISRVAKNPSVTFRVEEELREVHVKLWAVAGAAIWAGSRSRPHRQRQHPGQRTRTDIQSEVSRGLLTRERSPRSSGRSTTTKRRAAEPTVMARSIGVQSKA
jgi:DNA invertase Pin-like site-specific DNA recombinase